ncbi:MULTISPECIES: excalibur calcium-binding domain-containing protein [Streptomyces]|uniref:Excalibur calcium-binding domain-containing protein n=1 Tax=Streptomyces fimbriatus TaxID=68197 RepID=A0ABW0DGD4_STRFI|nr:excalibur calcium-binding domain-containing protein [Streptomyces sp.]
MNPLRTSAAALAALALAALPATAVAHDGDHPFKNCTEAYENGYADIPEGDDHYGEHLDRDGDGVGCDRPPADFVPHDDEGSGGGTDEDTDEETGSTSDGSGSGTDLAETGGSDATPYLAAGGAAVLLAGGGVLFAARRRRESR